MPLIQKKRVKNTLGSRGDYQEFGLGHKKFKYLFKTFLRWAKYLWLEHHKVISGWENRLGVITIQREAQVWRKSLSKRVQEEKGSITRYKTFRSQQRNLQCKQERAREEDHSQVSATSPKFIGECSQGRELMTTTGLGDAKRPNKLRRKWPPALVSSRRLLTTLKWGWGGNWWGWAGRGREDSEI